MTEIADLTAERDRARATVNVLRRDRNRLITAVDDRDSALFYCRERMAEAATELDAMAVDDGTLPERRAHLQSKAEGIRVALSYLDELTR